MPLIRQAKLTVRTASKSTHPHGAVPGPGTPPHGAVARDDVFSAAGTFFSSRVKQLRQPGQNTPPAGPNNITGQATKHHPQPWPLHPDVFVPLCVLKLAAPWGVTPSGRCGGVVAMVSIKFNIQKDGRRRGGGALLREAAYDTSLLMSPRLQHGVGTKGVGNQPQYWP